MHALFQFKNPDWTLEWGQPGNRVGKLEFGNVFWGEKGQWAATKSPTACSASRSATLAACEENPASTAHLSE